MFGQIYRSDNYTLTILHVLKDSEVVSKAVTFSSSLTKVKHIPKIWSLKVFFWTFLVLCTQVNAFLGLYRPVFWMNKSKNPDFSELFSWIMKITFVLEQNFSTFLFMLHTIYISLYIYMCVCEFKLSKANF